MAFVKITQSGVILQHSYTHQVNKRAEQKIRSDGSQFCIFWLNVVAPNKITSMLKLLKFDGVGPVCPAWLHLMGMIFGSVSGDCAGIGTRLKTGSRIELDTCPETSWKVSGLKLGWRAWVSSGSWSEDCSFSLYLSSSRSKQNLKLLLPFNVIGCGVGGWRVPKWVMVSYLRKIRHGER